MLCNGWLQAISGSRTSSRIVQIFNSRPSQPLPAGIRSVSVHKLSLIKRKWMKYTTICNPGGRKRSRGGAESPDVKNHTRKTLSVLLCPAVSKPGKLLSPPDHNPLYSSLLPQTVIIHCHSPHILQENVPVPCLLSQHSDFTLAINHSVIRQTSTGNSFSWRHLLGAIIIIKLSCFK